MMEYTAGLEPVTVPRSRRASAHLPMNATEWKQHQQVVGKINWVVTKLRVDYSHDLSVLQREKGRKKGPRVSALIKANQVLRELKRDSTFKVVMRPIDLLRFGPVAVSDSSLGNVMKDGTALQSDPATEKIGTQGGYLIMFADKELVDGGVGRFSLLEGKSHKLKRAARSS